MTTQDSSQYSDAVALAGRVLLSAIFLLSVMGKLAAPAGTIGYIAAAGLPLPQLAYALAVLIELGGGLALLAGYQTRIAAAALALFSVAAAFGFHANFGDQNQMVHFLKNLAIAGGLLQLVAFGSGRWSVDARLLGRQAVARYS
ncbi:MAG TPA: DoxX family protein [Burkholderiales bacterium]